MGRLRRLPAGAPHPGLGPCLPMLRVGGRRLHGLLLAGRTQQQQCNRASQFPPLGKRTKHGLERQLEC